MKVLQVVQHLKTGGLERVVLELVHNSEHKHSTYILALEGTKEQAVSAFPELSEIGDRLVCFNKQPGWQLSVVRDLIRLCKSQQIDLIHSHHIGPLLYTALAQIFTSSFEHIHTIHDAWFLQTKRYRQMFKLITSVCNVRLVADAKSVSSDVESFSGVCVDHTILNGIDTKRFVTGSKRHAREKLGLPSNAALVGCAARVERGKGHKDMIYALPKLPPKVALVFAGDGSLGASLKHFAAELGVANRIYWLGNIRDMPTFYQAIDSFCLFSAREGLPLTLLEAIASQTPVVSTDVGGVAEVVNTQVGILLSPNHTRALPSALMRSLCWPDNTSVFQQVRKHIDVKTMCKRYDCLFEKTASSGI